jgi:hypothetical protein
MLWRLDNYLHMECLRHLPSVLFFCSSLAAPAGKFVDVTSQSGVHFKHQASPTSKILGNGARLDDPTPAGTIPRKDAPKYWDRLFHQKPDVTFEDVTEKASVEGLGYSIGVAVGDYDNDSYEDSTSPATGAIFFTTTMAMEPPT